MAPSTFESELRNLLQKELLKQCNPDELDALGKSYFQLLQNKSSSEEEKISFSEIIEKSQDLSRSFSPIEKVLMDSFDRKEFEELDRLRYFPKIIRGIPRVYHKAHPARSHIKKNFAHLPSLKRLASDKALFSFYEKVRVDREAKITLFTWVISDGLGDCMAAQETAKLIKERFPECELQQIVLMPKQWASYPLDPCIRIPYETETQPSIIPHAALVELRTSDLILFLPTFYPHTLQLIERMKAMSATVPMPKMEFLGEYGYLESSWFHPRTGNRSMGLHFLEKGILIRKTHSASFSEIKNEQLLQLLFNTSSPGPLEIEEYLKGNHFYLAYLTTVAGGAVYLQALLKSLEHDRKGIDLCVPDMGWLIQWMEKENGNLIPPIFSVQKIEIWFDGKCHIIPVANEGKRVRILCCGALAKEDFRALVLLSGEFIAVRGNQSFSEAVSANKVFFYDGKEHVRYLIKDLLGLSENRIAAHRNALTVFRGMGKAFLHNLPEEEGEWVEETHFQEKEEWTQIALEIGLALQDPDAIAGLKKLNRILAEEYSCSDFLGHLVQRAICHKSHPEIERVEKTQIDLFASHHQSFGSAAKTIRRAIQYL